MRRSRAGSKAGSARSEARAAPLAFMYVVGLSRRTGTPATSPSVTRARSPRRKGGNPQRATSASANQKRSEEHTSELQSRLHLVCRLLLEKKKKKIKRCCK